MNTTDLNSFQNNVKKYLGNVISSSEDLKVNCPHEKNVVIMSQTNYANLIENMYVLGNPTNRKHLDKSIKEAAEGKYTEVDLDDL